MASSLAAVVGCSAAPSAPPEDEAESPIANEKAAPGAKAVGAAAVRDPAEWVPAVSLPSTARPPKVESSISGTGIFPLLENLDHNPVLSHVEIVPVFWGNNVNSSVTAAIGAFYADIVDSPYMDWLSEYGAGRGWASAPRTIIPFTTATTLTDADVAAELQAQINAAALPAPDGNTLYVVHLPPNIAAKFGTRDSCRGTKPFCGYHTHSEITIHSPFVDLPTNVRFAVLMDFGPGSGCDTGCGPDTMINNFTSLATHEIVEAVTDPDFDGWITASSPDFPDPGEEAGDLCNQEQETIVAHGHTYVVQKQWSNTAQACVATLPTGFHIPAAGCATAIGSGGPVPWILGCTPVLGNYQPYRWNGSAWELVPSGLGVKIAVSPEGTPWLVTNDGRIRKYNAATGQFDNDPAKLCASAVGVGTKDAAWAIGCDHASIYKLVGGFGGVWQQVAGAATTIAVEKSGRAWVGNAQGQIYVWNGTAFVPPGSWFKFDPSAPLPFPNGIAGCATSIAATEKGRYVIGCSSVGAGGNGIYQYRWTYPGWDQLAGAARDVAVTTDGTPWVVDTSGHIYVFNNVP